MRYVDGFVLPIPKERLDDYCAISTMAEEVWKEHGALDYLEFVIDDNRIEGMRSFSDLARASDDDVAIFAFITYESRAHRDEVNAKAMADPRLSMENFDHDNMPFKMGQMAYGGFRGIVDFDSP